MPKEQQYSIDIISALTERTIRRLWITIILLLVLFVGTNAGWICYESQFSKEITTTEQTVLQSTEDGNNSNIGFVGGDYIGDANS